MTSTVDSINLDAVDVNADNHIKMKKTVKAKNYHHLTNKDTNIVNINDPNNVNNINNPNLSISNNIINDNRNVIGKSVLDMNKHESSIVALKHINELKKDNRDKNSYSVVNEGIAGNSNNNHHHQPHKQHGKMSKLMATNEEEEAVNEKLGEVEKGVIRKADERQEEVLKKDIPIDEEIVKSVSQLETVITKTIENTQNINEILAVDNVADPVSLDAIVPSPRHNDLNNLFRRQQQSLATEEFANSLPNNSNLTKLELLTTSRMGIGATVTATSQQQKSSLFPFVKQVKGEAEAKEEEEGSTVATDSVNSSTFSTATRRPLISVGEALETSSMSSFSASLHHEFNKDTDYHPHQHRDKFNLLSKIHYVMTTENNSTLARINAADPLLEFAPSTSISSILSDNRISATTPSLNVQSVLNKSNDSNNNNPTATTTLTATSLSTTMSSISSTSSSLSTTKGEIGTGTTGTKTATTIATISAFNRSTTIATTATTLTTSNLTTLLTLNNNLTIAKVTKQQPGGNNLNFQQRLLLFLYKQLTSNSYL